MGGSFSQSAKPLHNGYEWLRFFGLSTSFSLSEEEAEAVWLQAAGADEESLGKESLDALVSALADAILDSLLRDGVDEINSRRLRFRGSKRRRAKFDKYFVRMQELVVQELVCNSSRNRILRALQFAPPHFSIDKGAFVECAMEGLFLFINSLISFFSLFLGGQFNSYLCGRPLQLLKPSFQPRRHNVWHGRCEVEHTG